MKYIEIDKSKIKKLYSDGVESNIYLYDLDGQTVLLKLLKDKSSLKNKEKKVNIIIDSDILKDEVNILASASINGQFVGYFMPLDLEYTRTVSDFDKKRVKISALKQLRDKMERFNKNGIYIGDFNEKNILIDKENNIKLCDLDNFKINDLDFDTPSTFVHYFRRNCKNEEKVDNYCFNLFTVSLMEKIYSPYVLNYLTSNPLPRYMDSKENRKIVDKLVFLDDSYQKKYIIDNLTSKRI